MTQQQESRSYLSLAQCAELIGRSVQTLRDMRQTGWFLDPDVVLVPAADGPGVPGWDRARLIAWAQETGRLDAQGRPISGAREGGRYVGETPPARWRNRPEEYLSGRACAVGAGISVSTLRKLRLLGTWPNPDVTVGIFPGWSRETFARARHHTSEVAA
ncbi:hypothetical protein [Bailinhaonella thermotolerans]|uniref:Uncharacterized protein n=1 Tax=Bailinhaonella thermotolerans TaxID=1070861 RepID=A0A3A4AKE1_9ACTN|nr:hypothetical protein [Bailinhaonella thermotolerans]RJL19244.1 hypothetical protein D5H75_40575 [Bailinhaonella thermotolerans]